MKKLSLLISAIINHLICNGYWRMPFAFLHIHLNIRIFYLVLIILFLYHISKKKTFKKILSIQILVHVVCKWVLSQSYLWKYLDGLRQWQYATSWLMCIVNLHIFFLNKKGVGNTCQNVVYVAVKRRTLSWKRWTWVMHFNLNCIKENYVSNEIFRRKTTSSA